MQPQALGANSQFREKRKSGEAEPSDQIPVLEEQLMDGVGVGNAFDLIDVTPTLLLSKSVRTSNSK